ncbi:nuclear receptor coactivator 6-like [Anneissia japonica]|uniref:nuclear receptor coactivator 6-like n=1 Tax=Anneissia japonica TaxID=1529436 RepID=UPI00142587E7|nr:nuclear receptor coactivator 6-like [Anneissia japonica]
MAASSDSDTESSFIVITCKGNINDHDLTEKLQKIKLHLSRLSESDDELLSISKIEPWNSVRVTFNIPPEAAQRLQHLAQNDSQLLQNLGILSVQVENNDLVNIPPPQVSTPVSQHVQPPFSVGLSPGQSAMSSGAPTSSPMRMTVANHQQSNVMNQLNFGGMRPNLQWGQVQMPRMQGNIPSGMQGNIQVGIPPTLQGSIPSGMQPGIQAGIQLNMHRGMQPGVPQNVQGGIQPGMHANMQTGIQGNIQPGVTPPNIQGNMQSGMPPGSQTSMQSGRQSGMQGNVQPGMQQGLHANMQPGMQGSMQPGMQVAVQPGMQGGLPPGMQGNMQPGMQGGMQPGMQGGMQIPPGMQGGMQPGIQGGMQPAMQGGMQSGMQPNMPQGMQQGMNPNVPFNQMSQFFFQGEMPMQRFGLNMSPPADARPKKKRRSRPKTKKKNAEKDKDVTKSPESQLKEADSPQTTGEIKPIATPPPSLANNQMSPATNTNQSNTNQNQQAPTSLPFAEPMQPRSTTSTPPIRKPDVSITSPLLVNLLQREIPGTQFPFSSRGIVPSSLANAVQQGVVNPKKPMNNLSQSTLSQGLPPMPPASEITRMLPESIGLPPLPTSQSTPAMSSSQMSSSQSNLVCSQTPNRQPVNTMNQPVPTQHFQSPSNTTQMNQPISDATHNLFATSQNVHSSAVLTNVSAQKAQQNMPTLANSNVAGFTTVSGMPLQQPSSVMQPGLGVPFGHIEQARQTPTPLSNNMSPPVRLSGMQSPGPNNLPFTTPGMINTSMAHGMPTPLQQAQALQSAGPTSVYQQGMNQMIHQGQRQFPSVTSQIRNQLPFALQVQHQQSQIHQLNQYLPSNINQHANAGQTPTNQGLNFPQGTNFNQGPMFHQRPQVSVNMPFNMVNIPVSTATANLPQFRMATSTELPHVSGKGGIPGTGGNVMQTGPMSLISGSTNKLPVHSRGNQQMPHTTHLPPTSITFPSIPRFPVKPPSKSVMPFDETTLDGISDAEKDLLAMAEKVANEAGMETSNRMANLFSKDSSRDEKQTSVVSPKDLLTKDPGHLKMSDFVNTSGNEEIKDVKSDNHKQKKSPVIQLTKNQHDLFTTGDTQNIASWSSTILPIHGKEGYSLHTHTPPTVSDKKTVEQVDRNNQQKAGELIEGGVPDNSQTIKSTFCLPSDGTSKSSSSRTVEQGAGVGVPVSETGAHYVSINRGEIPYHNINFLSQFNPGAVSDKKLDNPHLAADELKNRNKHQSFGTNINVPAQNLNQGPVPERKVSDKSSILMQMMNMDSSHDNPDMMSLTRSISEPVGTHGGQTTMAQETIHTDSNKMPILERMPTDSESNPTQYQQENGTDVAEMNAKQAVPGLSQPLMPQLMPKQPLQQQKVNIYSPKPLLLPSCMPPPTHVSTGNLVNPENQKPASSAQFNKRSRSVSPVTQQGSEFPRLPLGGGQFIKQTQSPTTSSPSGMGMSASALLSSIAKSAYNAGMTPRIQSPSESRPSTSQPIGLPPNTSAPSPTGLPLYANPLGPDAHTKPITVRVSPVPTPEVIKSTPTPLLPSVLPIVSQSSKNNEPKDMRGYSNLSSSVRAVEMKQAPVILTQITHLEEPTKSSIPHQETIPDQPPSSNVSQVIAPVQAIQKEESTPSIGQSNPDISIGHNKCSSISNQLGDVETSNSTQELSKDSSAAKLKRKHDNDAPSDPAPKVLKIESDATTNVNQVNIEDDSSELQNIQQTDGDPELSGDHRPLPLLVRESNIEVGKTFTGNDGTSDDPSLMDATAGDNDVVAAKEVLTMPTLLPSKVELTDIAKCKDSKYDTAISLALETTSKVVEGSKIAGDTNMPLPPKDLPVQSDVTKTDIAKDTTESKQEGTPSQIDSKLGTTSATTSSKSLTETSPASSKDCTKSSPVERRTTPKRKAAEEASRPVSERAAQNRQCTNQQVDEPPATRARRTTRNKSPTDHPTRLREREREDSIGSCRDQHTDPGTDNDGRMTRKRSTRIIGKGNKDNKEK